MAKIAGPRAWRIAGCVAGALLLSTLASQPARADGDADPEASGQAYAMFALVLGVNTSVDPGAPPLRYADDDAARYLELFRTLGARTYVLTRPDDNTRRLHPQLAAEALLPVKSDFDRAVASLAYDVDQARRRHVKTVLYFVYAGHGSAEDGHGYITLEDARLDAALLDASVVDSIAADHTHFIVDACDSYFLALGRGPGGSRREAHGFLQSGGLRVRDSVGLLLSTSSARESHEWSGFQAGVFSHEVRSALYGAADADGDGEVSYQEVAAFVSRANEAIPNEAYRANVYARPPKDDPYILDLRGKWRSRLDVPAQHAGHYLLEDSRGVRVADFHNAAGQRAYLVRPRYSGRLYLRRLDDDVEFVIPNEPDVVEVAELTPGEPRDRSRGAASDQFAMLFALPFGEQSVVGYRLRPLEGDASGPEPVKRPAWRVYTGLGLVAAGLASGAAGALTLASSRSLGSSVGAQTSQADVAAVDDRIHGRNVAGGIAIAAGSVVAVTGAALALWPARLSHVDTGVSVSSAWIGYHGTF